jgi:hypothetical protein
MPKYRVGANGFPVGQFLIPSGTALDQPTSAIQPRHVALIDTDAMDQWSQLRRWLDPPVDAQVSALCQKRK